MSTEKEVELLCAEKELAIGGKVITVKPYSWMESLKVAQPFGSLVNVFIQNMDGIDAVLKGLSEKDQTVAEQISVFVQTINAVDFETVSEALLKMMQVAAKQPRDFIEGLPTEDAIALGSAIYEVNKHFFTKCFAGKVQKKKARSA